MNLRREFRQCQEEEGVAEKGRGREGRKEGFPYLEFLIGPVSVWNYGS